MTERMRQPSPEELARWEATLHKEGLAPEPAFDKGKAALHKNVAEHVLAAERESEAITHALRNYFLTRGAVLRGHHKQIAVEIEHELGLKFGDIDEVAIEAVSEEIRNAHLLRQTILRELIEKKPQIAFREAHAHRFLHAALRKDLPDFSDDEIDVLVRTQDDRPAYTNFH